MPVSSTSFQERLHRIQSGYGRADGLAGTNPASRKAKNAFGSLFRTLILVAACGVAAKTGATGYFGEDQYAAKVGDMVKTLPPSVAQIVMPDPYTNWVANWVVDTSDELISKI